jgi:hypothetical protein
MTRFGAAVAAAGVLAAAADGQTPITPTMPTPPTPPAVPSPFAGVPVGTPLLKPIGQQVGTAVPKSGTPLGYHGPDGKPINTEKPPGQVIDLSNLAAPLTAPLPPGLDAKPKSVFQQVYDKWRSALGLTKPATPGTTTNNWTPGLARRNRERKQQQAMWARD